jgi:hypothetical protein
VDAQRALSFAALAAMGLRAAVRIGRAAAFGALLAGSAAAGAQAVPGPALYLWEVSTLTNRAYLYGTVHAGKAAWFPLPPRVESALADSRVLVVEADITDTASMAKSARTLGLDADDRLERHVRPEDYARFRKLLAKYSIPEEQLVRLKPFIAASLLVFNEWARLGYLPQHGIDAYLLRKAKAEAKKVVEIEGAAVQAELMDSLTEEEGRLAFEGMLRALESGLAAEQITGMVNAWQVGDPGLLLEVARNYNTQVPGAAAFEEKFIWGRHEAMTKKIEGYLNESRDRHFIAVGALHLAGPRGLVEMLRKRGYLVKQAMAAGPAVGAR